jgi:hypothetical protein
VASGVQAAPGIAATRERVGRLIEGTGPNLYELVEL